MPQNWIITLSAACYNSSSIIMTPNCIYSQERICFCSSNDSARKASRKNHTQFINHRKGSNAKPPTNEQPPSLTTFCHMYYTIYPHAVSTGAKKLFSTTTVLNWTGRQEILLIHWKSVHACIQMSS